MTRYYYVVNAFPSLVLEKKPEVSYLEAREIALQNLTPKDTEQLIDLQRPIDLRNIRALWLDEDLDPRGSFTEKELEEALLVQDGLPPFIIDFLQRYETTEERLRYFSSLYSSLYSQQLKNFIDGYYRLEREIRLVLVALRVKHAKRSLLEELQFEDPADPFVAQLLAQKDSDEFVVPQEYEALKNVFQENRLNPRNLYRASLSFRISRIRELEEKESFGIDQVLGYLARLLLIEDWHAQDEKQGRFILEQKMG